MVHHTIRNQRVHVGEVWASSMVVFYFHICVHGSNKSGASRGKPSSYTELWVCFCSSYTKEMKT